MILRPFFRKKTPWTLGGLVFLVFLLSLPLGFANAVPDDFQSWQIVALQGKITQRTQWYIDFQNNIVELTPNSPLKDDVWVGQLVIRPGVGYKINDDLSLWGGYAWVPVFQPEFRNENQIWKQAIYNKKTRYFHFTNRSRLEIRKFGNVDGASVRFRNRLRLAVPLGKSRWSVVVYGEPFFNLNSVDNGPQSGFNQAWLFAGLNRQLHDRVSMDFGYLNNFVNNPAPANDRVNHVLMLSVNINFANDGKSSRPDRERPGHTRHKRVASLKQPEPQIGIIDLSQLDPQIADTEPEHAINSTDLENPEHLMLEGS